MIAQGTDGISRGDKGEGVLQGKAMMEYVPLHKGVLDRSEGMGDWIMEIMGTMEHTVLKPSGWFDGVNREGNFVWVPPPSCGEVIVEQLGNARHKRPNCLHVVVIPRLQTGRWRRYLGRATDLCLTLWPDPAWPIATMFEPIVLFVGLPYQSHYPLLQSRDNRMEKLRREVSAAGMREGSWRKKRALLRKFLHEARRICPL